MPPIGVPAPAGRATQRLQDELRGLPSHSNQRPVQKLSDLLAAVDGAQPVGGEPGVFVVDDGGTKRFLKQDQLLRLRGGLNTALQHARSRLLSQLKGTAKAHTKQKEFDREHRLAAWVSQAASGTSYLGAKLEGLLAKADQALSRIQTLIQQGNLEQAALRLEEAERLTQQAIQTWHHLQHGTVEGAQTAIESLQITKDVATVTVGLLAVIVTGGAAAAGTSTAASVSAAATANAIATATPLLATAGTVTTQAALGMRVDWTKVGQDALVDLALTKFGGRLSQALYARLLGHSNVRRLGKAAFARIVSSVLTHQASTTVRAAADAVYAKLRGKKISWRVFVEQLAHQLTDPKGLFISALFGAVVAKTQAAASPRVAVRQSAANKPCQRHQRLSSDGSRGARNRGPLAEQQIDEIKDYARTLKLEIGKDIVLGRTLRQGLGERDVARTGYSDLYDAVLVYPNVAPSPGYKRQPKDSVIRRMTIRATLAHEVVGHLHTSRAGKAHDSGGYKDEIQASVRAAYLAPGLSSAERFQLLRDAAERLQALNRANGTKMKLREARRFVSFEVL